MENNYQADNFVLTYGKPGAGKTGVPVYGYNLIKSSLINNNDKLII